MRKWLRIFAAAVLVLAMRPGEGLAASDDPQEPVQVMLASYELSPAGGGEPITFTPFIEVFDQDSLWDICYGEPKIRDAFNMELMTRRVKVDKAGHPILEPLVPRLTKLGNRALGKRLIRKLHLAEGEYDKDWRPETPPPVPNHRNCARIELRTKRIK